MPQSLVTDMIRKGVNVKFTPFLFPHVSTGQLLMAVKAI